MAYNEFAYFYDEFNGEADYDALYGYITDELKAHGITDGILADLGCGTGDLTLMLTQAGYDVIGIDRSEEMLSVLREKADELGLTGRLLLLKQDLLDLDLYGTIRAAVSTFDTYSHIGPQENFEKAIRKAAYFMEQGGVFIFDLNTPYKHRTFWQARPLTSRPRTPTATGRTATTRRRSGWILPSTLTTTRRGSTSTRRSASTATRWTPCAPCWKSTASPWPKSPTARVLARCAATARAGSSRLSSNTHKRKKQMEQNHNMLRGISENGGIVFYGVDSTEIVREMERLHKTSAVTTAALGRLLTAASMMGIMLKSTQDSVTLQIKGGGPAGRLLAVSDGTGNVKGYVEHPVVELPPRADGHLNVGAAVGKDGTLDVIRDLGMREPYIGQVPLTSGEIAEDITTYFAISEQVPTVCALGVLVDKDLSVRCAGGFVVQLLPGATEEEIEHLEKNIKAMPSVTTMLEEGKSVRDMLELALAGFAPDILDSYHVTYKCDCGLERVEKMIRSLGKKEVERMRDEDPVAEVNCQFCNKNYKVDLNELLKNWPSTAENVLSENA